MIGWFKKRFNTPIEERSYSLLYAGLALVLFLTTLWAVYNEVDGRRPWKDYQEEFRSLKVRVLNMRGREAKAKLNSDELKSINKEIAQIDRKLHSGEARSAQSRIDDLAMKIRDLSQDRANIKSKADNRNYLFEHSSREHDKEDADDYKKERTELEGQMAALDVRIDSLEKEKAKLVDANIAPLASRKKELETRKDSLYGTVADLKKKVEETRAMPIKIRQVMLNDFEKTNFGKLQMRADRCQSCHLGIDDPVFADTTIFTKWGKGQVFKTEKAAVRARKVFGPHPYAEMLKTHKVERFGCTPCHGGQPMSVDDVEHAHGFEAHWESPLLVGQYVQGSCRKCHEGSYNFSSMERVAEGRKLFIDFGCFGCHEGPSIPDWKEYKVGPSLLNIAKKVSSDWAYHWVMNPQSWNEHTRMPNFQFNAEQAEAVVAYLFDASKGSDYKPVSSAPSGDPQRGAVTLKEVGCVACHTIDEYKARGEFKFVQASDKKSLWPNQQTGGNRVGEGNNFGPDLNNIGSKVSADWLYDWVKNPKHFNPTSRMPILRLSDQEAADITAYLMTKKSSSPWASASLSHLNDPAWIKKGEKLIREYGCFGCHHIKGMENEGKVSVGLEKFGAKTASDLYFGYLGEEELHGVRSHFKKAGYNLGSVYMHLENGEDWFVWTALKMKNPRVFATDAIPQKMPVFNMTDEEAFALTVALRSYTPTYVPASFKDPAGVLQPAVDDGRFLTHWNNCVGCHRIEGHGGLVLDLLRAQLGLKGDDINPYGPPNLNTAGAKLQENWFYNFVRDPSSEPVRTWLKIRMPTYAFSPQQISRLDRYFLGLERETLGFTEYTSYPATSESMAAGRQLFEQLKCQQCHPVGSSPAVGGATAVPAPNLMLAGGRLKPEWIARWLRDPQAVAPGTKMPNFFGTLDAQVAADPKILGGDWQAQVNAIRDYVWRLGGAKGGVVGGGDTAVVQQPAGPVAQTPKKPDSAAGKRISMR